GATHHRVLGFGTLTIEPAPARSHRGIVDAVAHDHYAGSLNRLVDQLISEARGRGLECVRAFVAAPDAGKKDLFRTAGFRAVATLAAQLRVGDRLIDVDLLELSLR